MIAIIGGATSEKNSWAKSFSAMTSWLSGRTIPRLVKRWMPSRAISITSSCWPPANMVTSLPKNSSQEPAWTGSHSPLTPGLAASKRVVSGFIWSARPGAPSSTPLTLPGWGGLVAGLAASTAGLVAAAVAGAAVAAAAAVGAGGAAAAAVGAAAG